MWSCPKKTKKYWINVVNGYSSVASSTALANVVGRHLQGMLSCEPREKDDCMRYINDLDSYISLAGVCGDLLKQLLLQEIVIPLSKSAKKQLKKNYDLGNDLIGRYGSMLWTINFAVTEYVRYHSNSSSSQTDKVMIDDIWFYGICILAGGFALISNADIRDFIKKQSGFNVKKRDAFTITCDGIFSGIDSFLRWRGFIASIQGILNFAYKTDQWVYSDTAFYCRVGVAGGWSLFSGIIHGALSPRASTSDLFPLKPKHKNNLQLILDFTDAFIGSCFFAFFTFLGVKDLDSIHKIIVSGGLLLVAAIIPLLYIERDTKEEHEEDSDDSSDEASSASDLEDDQQVIATTPLNRFFGRTEYGVK